MDSGVPNRVQGKIRKGPVVHITNMDTEFGLAVTWLAGLSDIALSQAHPVLAQRMMRAALLVALGSPVSADKVVGMRETAASMEASGPERRCVGFLADALEWLGLVARLDGKDGG